MGCSQSKSKQNKVGSKKAQPKDQKITKLEPVQKPVVQNPPIVDLPKPKNQPIVPSPYIQVQPKEVKQDENLKLFNSLKPPGSRTMEVDDIISWFQELGIQLTDPFGGCIFYIMKSESPSRVTKEQFKRLTDQLKVTSLDQMKKAIPKLRKQFSESRELYKSVYMHLFELYKENDTIKVIPFELASQLWTLYLPAGRFPLSNFFLQYLKTAEVKTVSRDTWIQVHHFLRAVNEDFQDYKQTDGWVVLIDKFVEFAKGN